MDGQARLFAGDGHGAGAEPERIDLPDADVVLHRGFLDPATHGRLLAAVDATTSWRQDHIVVFGRRSPVPRLQAWYGDPGCSYSYSGIVLDPQPWTPALAELRKRVEAVTGERHNCVLANCYRHGRDSVAWHADDEPELGPEPVVASVSLGAERAFSMRRRDDATTRHTVVLAAGSLLVMRGSTQRHWLHAVPRTSRVVGRRLNLTFRWIDPTAGGGEERGEGRR